MAKDTINIHGKEYETVASRVARFRKDHGDDYAITTNIYSIDADTVVMQASISKDDKVIATGYAEEKRNASTINRTSALENCETSAIGRALAAYGMAGTEYASADEVAQAISRQPSGPPKTAASVGGQGYATPKQRAFVSRLLDMRGIASEDQKGYMIEKFGVTVPLTVEGASFVIDELQGGGNRTQTVGAGAETAAVY